MSLRKPFKISALLLFILCSLLGCSNSTINTDKETAITNPIFPKSVGYVNDFENVFTSRQEQLLEERLKAYQEKTSREIAIITVASIAPYNDIKDYATDISNHWGVGNKEENNGLTILISTTLRKIRITTGLGTQNILTDEICQKVIDEVILPEFKSGDYYQGIDQGITALMNYWK